MRNAFIKSVGAYVPERIITNKYFNEILNEDVDTWLVTNLTIKERRWCADNESTADLCVNAANVVLKRANLNAEELDLIIISTDTPEFISPSTASVVQHRINAVKSGTFDLNTACAGFVTALDVACKYIIADKRHNNILVIGAYAMSKYLDLYDKKTVTLFADGAGAVIVSSTNEQRGFLASRLHTEGVYNSWMGIYAGGTNKPINEEVIQNKDHLLKFVRKFPKEINPIMWSKMITELSEQTQIPVMQFNHYFMTQININGIWETMDKLEVPRERAHAIMEKYAYTGSACIPMALNDAYEKGKLNIGDKIIFMGSGGGLAFASAAFIW